MVSVAPTDNHNANRQATVTDRPPTRHGQLPQRPTVPRKRRQRLAARPDVAAAAAAATFWLILVVVVGRAGHLADCQVLELRWRLVGWV
jgi:hypothetical protein